MNKPFASTHHLTLGIDHSLEGGSPDMSVNSDVSVGTKKVLLYSSNSAKFFPKEETDNLKLNISEDMSFNVEKSPSRISLSPKRSAIRNKGKSGTSYFFNAENGEEFQEDIPARTEGKKKQ